MNILLEIFKLNHQYGQLLNTARKILTIDHSPRIVLTTNQKLTNEIGLPMKFIPEVKSTDFTREQTQAVKSNNLNYILNDKNTCLILRTRIWKRISRISTIIGERTRNIWTFEQEKTQYDTKQENLGKKQNDRIF